MSYSLCSLLHYPVTLPFLGQNILLNIVFSNTLSLLSSLNTSDQVSHTKTTTDKIIVLPNISIFIFWIANWKTKILNLMIAIIPLLQSALNFFLKRIFICSSCSKIFLMLHPINVFIVYIYVLILRCILISRHDHILSFIGFYV
jgi:hypothetical protein